MDTKDLEASIDGLTVQDASTTRTVKKVENGYEVAFTGDVTNVLEANRELRNEAQRLNLTPKFDNDGFVHLGRIPRVMCDKWWSEEGFDIHSAARSGMTQEEHWKEILRRLSGDYSQFNVSKYGRLT